MTANYTNFHFGQCLALLNTLYPALDGLIAFDRSGDQIWGQSAGAVDEQKLAALMSKLLSATEDSQTRQLPGGNFAELVKLRDPQGDPVLLLCLLSSRGDPASLPKLAGQPAFTQLSAMLLADYCRNIELVTRDNEVEQLRDQLTRRERELSLIYKAEDQAVNTYHGRELLRQLVQNTSRFLSDDVIFLYIVSHNVALHRYRDDHAVFHADMLFDCMRESIYPLLHKDSRPLLVNNVEERRELGIEQEMPFKFAACPVTNSGGEMIGLLATANQETAAADFTFSDCNLLEVMAKKASKIVQSHFDPLTGLENSHSFELILRDLLRQSRDRGVNHAIANIDIDRLAVVNDISGRAAGNHLIKMIAHKLVDAVRSQDLVARLGSDKFGILLKNCNLQTAAVIMKKLSHAVSSLDVEWEGKRHEPSVSIGVAPITDQTLSVTGLLEAAETARNVSKQRGRNNIHVLDMEDRNLLRRKEQIRWVGRIQEAMRDDRFLLYAQLIEPIGSLSSRQHYEILLRLREKDGQIIDPGQFLAAAESFYLMASLDLWVINQAFHELTLMQPVPDQQQCQLSINLSGQSLNDPYTLASYIENKLEEYELDGERICFEITESAAIANLDEAGLFIEHIRELGCKFSLDDFGTGLSSFSYLKNLNVDYLKIDGSFVRDIMHDPVSESMVAAINQVGQAMHLETVAEYVEDDEIRRKLVSIGVDYGQGFGIGEPALFSQIRAELARSA
jgi:diguanylate cyclase (GGDEF)-like protein